MQWVSICTWNGEAVAKKEIVTIVGARPQFVKAAVISRLIRNDYQASFSEYLVHTGQHYDTNMSRVFFEQMRIPAPDINLGIGSRSHGHQTGAMLAGLEDVLRERRPDCVIVYGDTNSTLAGALAASKLGIPVAHVEAGLRSHAKSMPEEQNRVLTDHLADVLFCPSEVARENLSREGITRGVSLVGDVMYDAANFYRLLLRAERTEVSLPAEMPSDFYLLTLHRAENTDNRNRLQAIVDALNAVHDIPCIFPVHPRTRLALQDCGLTLGGHIRAIEPVGFLEMLVLEERCRFVVTDSGGVQKEAYFVGKPCITLRDQTEWVETVEYGWNALVGADSAKIQAALRAVKPPPSRPSLYGDGSAGRRIVQILQVAI